MTPAETHEALELAAAIAKDAAAILLEGFRSALKIQKKGDVDLLTEFDLRSEALIRERLGAAFPDHAIYAEEGEKRDDRDCVWYVDPLDGTTNFAHGHPMFCVSMALYEAHEPRVGVVLAPALGLIWQAGRGLGATRNGQPCVVSSIRDLSDALCATGFPYDRRSNDDDNTREHRAFLKRAQGIRRGGSAAIDLAMVADGTFDLYWEQRLGPWDMAAGALLVLEAGGQLSDYDGSPPHPLEGRVLASNGHLHDAALEVVQAVRGSLPTPAPGAGPPGSGTSAR